MKRFLITLSASLLISGFAMTTVNAQSAQQDGKKAATETKMNCSKGSAATKPCCMTAETKTSDPAKCKEMKCDATKCKGKADGQKCNMEADSKTPMKDCDHSKCEMAKK